MPIQVLPDAPAFLRKTDVSTASRPASRALRGKLLVPRSELENNAGDRPPEGFQVTEIVELQARALKRRTIYVRESHLYAEPCPEIRSFTYLLYL